MNWKMTEPFSKDLKHFPKVALVCEQNSFSLEIIKLLLEKDCCVIVLNKQKSDWNDLIKDDRVDNVIIKTPGEYFEENIYLDYVLCLGINDKQSGSGGIRDESALLSIDLAKRNSCKALFVFNSFCDEDDLRKLNFLRKFIADTNDLYAGIILLADYVFVKNGSTNTKKLYSNFIKADLKKETLHLDKREKYYILDAENAAHKILDYLFSLRGYGKTTGFYSRETNAGSFERNLLEKIKDFNIVYERRRYLELSQDEKVYINSGNKKAIENIYQILEFQTSKKSIRTSPSFFKIKPKILHKPLGPSRAKKKPLLKFAIYLLACFFLFPFMLGFISASLFFVGKYLYFKLDPSQTSLFFKLSNNFISINQKYLYSASQAPYINRIFFTINTPNRLLKEANTVAVEGLEILTKTVTLTKTITVSGILDAERLYLLYLDLENFYNHVGFLEAESKVEVGESERIARLLLGNLNLEELKSKIVGARDLTRVLPEITGGDKPTQFMILFQKNSIPRPTGGVIEKVAIINFSGGEVINFENLEIESIDKNLYGQIDIPVSLNKYLDKDSMDFKEVNWDPDFLTTANKAEWFLEKALDESVDGVIAVNEGFLEKYNDAQKTLLKNNFKFNKSIEFLFFLASALDNNDIQIFVNNNQANEALLKLKSGVKPEEYECSINCYSDALGLYEYAHENSQAKYLERKASLMVSLEEKLIKRKLTYYLNNVDNQDYKGILRIFVPGDSGFGVIDKNQNDEKSKGDLVVQGIRGQKVADIYFEVSPQSTSVISLNWESGSKLDFSKEGWYALNWKKQSGIESFPISLRVEKGKSIVLYATPAFTLTDGDFMGYNTELSRDYVSRIFWNKQDE